MAKAKADFSPATRTGLVAVEDKEERRSCSGSSRGHGQPPCTHADWLGLTPVTARQPATHRASSRALL